MKFIFWTSAFLVCYSYVLYPAWLFLRARLRPRPVCTAPSFPTVSIVIAARNERDRLEGKLANLSQFDYPPNLLNTIIVSDGSTDGTNEIISKQGDRLRAVILPGHVGKAEALNRALQLADGEIVLFMDVRQRVALDAVRVLVENFADPSVGCVSGALDLRGGAERSPGGVRTYWNFEKAIRKWESESGSTIGATGALYAVRRRIIPNLPAALVLDDVFIPMSVAREGLRVIFEPRAVAWEQLAAEPAKEFRRKVRTLFGNYQLLRLAPWLLRASYPLRFEFVSHKLSRLAVPFALCAMIATSLLLTGAIYRVSLACALALALLGLLALVRARLGMLNRVTDMALAFVLLNAAAVVAFLYFVSGKKRVWVR